MKIVFLSNGLTHYYNFVLSKLNSQPEVELVVVVPVKVSAYIGEGVKQTRDGINFNVIELEEVTKLLYSGFKGLAQALLDERPDIVIVSEAHLRAFLFDLPVIMAMKSIQAGLILKWIPFRLPMYPEALQKLKVESSNFNSLPATINSLLRRTGLARLARRLLLYINKRAYNLPDAHVNYVEAYDVLASYGIDREQIFITRNSPDTDILFKVKESLTGEPPILSPNPYRLLHVGRLVEWKRVDMLLHAFARVRERFPMAELLVIGTGPQETTLKKLAEELNTGASVIFTGGVYDPQQLGQYFMASSLYVLAGMGGLSINDAMCFGLPVLCSVGDGTEKVLVREGINGRYFQDGDEDDLCDKIIWFFEHEEQLPKMGDKSEEIIRNDVNIHTVINGYMGAFHYVHQKRLQ